MITQSEEKQPLTDYEQKVVKAFRDVCEKNFGRNGNALQVTALMEERKELKEGTTFVDVRQIMLDLMRRKEL